jgi:ribosomal protein S18 acetylase RimI-like enzyme
LSSQKDRRVDFKPLTVDHIRRLGDIRADYISERYIRLSKTGEGGEIGFSLRAKSLLESFQSQGLSIVRQRDREEILSRMGAKSVQLVAEEKGRLIALLDAQVESWRRVLKIQNLLVDRDQRRQGIGTELLRRAIEFAEEKRCRAISLEAQATNWPALNFYLSAGFQVCGVDDHHYTNRDLDRKEVALFLYREL